MARAEPTEFDRSRTTARRLAPGAYDALLEALAVVFWNKPPFERFLRVALRDHPELLVGLSFAETKREVAGDLVMRLAQKEDCYQAVTIDLMRELARMDEFPNLQRQDDREQLVAVATAAVSTLRKWTAQYSEIAEAREKLERERHVSQAGYEARRSHARVLEELKVKFLAMYSDPDPHGRGRSFEELLNRLFFLFDLNPGKSFVIADEQLDGAFTFNTDDYLLKPNGSRHQRLAPMSTFSRRRFSAKARTRLDSSSRYRASRSQPSGRTRTAALASSSWTAPTCLVCSKAACA